MRFGIIGCGGIAGWHANAIRELENGSLTAVCDIRKAVSEAYAAEYGALPFQDADALLESGLIDAVAICTPSGTHAQLAEKALRRCIHAIVEKPLAITPSSLASLMNAAVQSQAELFPILQMRCLPDVMRAKALLREGRLGRITLCDLSMKYYREPRYYIDQPWHGTRLMDGGGALINQGIHGLDLLRHLCGEVAEARAFQGTLCHSIETEDTFAASLRLASGALGVVTAGTAAYPGSLRRLEICGTDGSMVLSEGTITALSIRGEAPEKAAEPQKSGTVNPFAIDDEPHRRQYRNIQAHLEKGEPLILDAVDAAKTLELIFSLYHAASANEISPPSR